MTRMVRAAALTNYFEVAQQVALNPSAMLREAGVERALLADPDARIPASVVINLLEHSARASHCTSFGLRMAETRQISHFGPVGLLVTHQRTLREVLLALINYRHLLNEALALHIEDCGELVIIREEVVTDGAIHSRQATELALGVLARACSALLGSHWKPHCVLFTHAAPRDLQLHRRIFKCDLQFGAEYNGLVCAAADLNYPCSAANPALARYAEQFLQALPKSHEKSTGMEVREAIYLLLPMGRATVEQVAQSLAVNVRTLQRQLEEEGETFSGLINSVRRALAVRYIEGGQHSLGHIAELLGYATQTSFTRWFKTEFGMAPTQWDQH
ncbi:MAG: AraC family transcriptional regulator [Steroidobacteraceae bacterium]